MHDIINDELVSPFDRLKDAMEALREIARITYRRRKSGAIERKAFTVAITALGYSSAQEFAEKDMP